MAGVSDEEFETLNEVALHRQGHLRFRLVTTLAIVIAFFPVAGLPDTVVWGVAYCCAQGLEAFTAARLRKASDRARPLAYFLAIAAMTIATAAFAAIGIMWSAAGGLGPTFAVYLLAGAIMHTIAFARLNQMAFAALTVPTAVVLAAQPIIVTMDGNVWDGFRTSMAVILMGVCAVKVWIGLRSGWRRERTLHEELSGALVRAEAASEAKSAFLATISHEIRTPLNGVLGMSQALEAEETHPERRRKLRLLTQSGEGLRAILNDVLDMSKIEAGALSVEDIDFDLDQLLEDVEGGFMAVAAERGLSFSVRSQGVGWRRGDPVRLRQVITNLVSNALKFTHDGSVEVTVTGRETSLRIEVADTGIGISEAEAGRVFDRFTQADPSTTRRYGGTGLGLPIAKEIVERLGGRISLSRSTVDQGSVFVVELPFPAVAAVERPGPRPTSEELGTSLLKVLAAEDNPTNQIVLKALLGAGGVYPTVVSNGREAVEAWEREHWDLILMDVQMPVLDGPSAVIEIRSAEARTGRVRTPIIAVTANALDTQVKAYVAVGMDDHVPKPLLMGDLFSAMERVLAVAPSDAEASAARAA